MACESHCDVWLHHFRSYRLQVNPCQSSIFSCRVPSVQTPEASFNEALPAARALWIGLPAGPSRDAVTGCRCGDDTRVFCGCFGDCRSKTFQNQWHVGDRGAHGGIRYPDGTTSTKVQRLSCLSKSKLWPHPLVEEIGAPDRLAEYRLSTPLGCRSRIFSDF